jgi:hypothetical protein
MQKFEQKQARSAGSGRLWRAHTGSWDGASFWQIPGRIRHLIRKSIIGACFVATSDDKRTRRNELENNVTA